MGDKNLPIYKLIRSKRRTIAIYIRGGEVEVRAPLITPRREIDKIVGSKEKWINDRLFESNERREQRGSFALNYGDLVTYRGEKYPIVARHGGSAGFDCENNHFYLPPNLSSEQIKSGCIQVYKMLAKNHLADRVCEFAGLMKVEPIAVKINSAKARWGSCSAKKSLNFSWRLIMADDDVIDYVVVHELAHITQMNHSPQFWAIVKKILPCHKASQLKLKELQKILAGQDWG